MAEAWTTDDEIGFINRLGGLGPQRTLEALRVYREALRRRRYWGRIDKERVLSALFSRINEIELRGV